MGAVAHVHPQALRPDVRSCRSICKLRPAVVISSAAYSRSRGEVIVAAITSNVRRRQFGDHLITNWKGAGLLFPSLVTVILRTIKGNMIERKLGPMPKPDWQTMDRLLRRSLSL